MKKKAKFTIEIEYVTTDEGITPETMTKSEIINLEQEGDYEGLTLAMLSGVMLAKAKGSSDSEYYSEKVLLLRSIASAYVNAVMLLRSNELIDDSIMDDEDLEMFQGMISGITNILTNGVAIISNLSDEEVNKIDKEYYEQNKQDNERNRTRPSAQDFL
jgi:hypothetical protein